jgi:hypothetical protein
MEAFLLPGINAENIKHFNPGVDIVHVIEKKKFNPVNRAQFNPGVESSPIVIGL